MYFSAIQAHEEIQMAAHEAAPSINVIYTIEGIPPFGTVLGTCRGVSAYSNQATDYRSLERNNTDNHGRFCGLKWQCVEYSRRYLHETAGFTFENVPSAYNIWDLKVVTQLETRLPHHFQCMENGCSTEMPQEGSLLIYPLQTDCPFGHVAVIVDVKFDENSRLGYVRIAEQNWKDAPWKGKDYARQLVLTRDTLGRYTITDDTEHAILGWKTIDPIALPDSFIKQQCRKKHGGKR